MHAVRFVTFCGGNSQQADGALAYCEDGHNAVLLHAVRQVAARAGGHV